MCNCNQKRAMYSSGNSHSQNGMAKVKLIQTEPIVLNGNITGRMYRFRNINDINWVDRRDLMSMKETTGLQIFF
jgi:hypothetical protein